MPPIPPTHSPRPAQEPDGTGRDAVITALHTAVADCPAELAQRLLDLLNATPEDIADQARLLLQKPYGTNAILQDQGLFGLSFARLLPGQSTSYHYHQQRREFFCVHSGVLTLRSGIEERVLQRYGCGTSTPLVGHSLANQGSGMLAVLEIFTPALLNDKVRIHDRYDRPLGDVTLHQ
jgi:mannose-6-phosphate isomerase-like protein (cupin superfamily)